MYPEGNYGWKSASLSLECTMPPRRQLAHVQIKQYGHGHTGRTHFKRVYGG